MTRTIWIVPAACAIFASTAMSQTGRSLKLMAPVVLGHTASIVMDHAPALAGHQFAMAMCSPNYPGSQVFSIPGVVEGVLRLDPLAYGVLGVGVLDASGRSPALTFVVPNSALLVGATFDIQGADVDGAGLITLTDNDIEFAVAEPPLWSLHMVPIPPDTFAMGSAEPLGVPPYYNEANAQSVHQVTITRPFWMGKWEVMQSDYLAMMGSNPSTYGAGYGGFMSGPVETVSRSEAIAYCDALTAAEAAAGRLPTGYQYRLPTEAEWEYCCRAGSTSEYYFGATMPNCFHANYIADTFCFAGHPIQVGAYLANPLGLFDMYGNVKEWCLDDWDGNTGYTATSVEDPVGTTGSFGVVRGGGYDNGASQLRSAYRIAASPSSTSPSRGFRVVCAPIL